MGGWVGQWVSGWVEDRDTVWGVWALQRQALRCRQSHLRAIHCVCVQSTNMPKRNMNQVGVVSSCCAAPCCAVLCCGQVYNKVLSWPPPIPGSSMCLPIGAGVINVRLPHFCIIPPPQPTVDPSVQVGAGAADTSRGCCCHYCFAGVVPDDDIVVGGGGDGVNSSRP